MTEKSWFVMHYNHFPPDGPIRVGQLIYNPKEPHIPIDFTGPQPFPVDLQHITAVEEDFSWEKSASHDGHAAISAQMDGLPVSGTISGEFQRMNRNWADFESLETEYIIPTPEYEKESMKRQNVKASIGSNLMLKSVFMITGVKIARRGTRGQETSNSKGGAFQIGVTPTPMVPISLGPVVGYNKGNSQKMSSKVTDFVWAFSVRQIYYRFGERTKSKTYDDGATLVERSRRAFESSEDSEEQEMEVDGSEDFNGEESRLVSIKEIRTIGEELRFVTVEAL